MNLTALRELAKRTLVDYEIASRHTEAGATLVTLARALLAALDVVEEAGHHHGRMYPVSKCNLGKCPLCDALACFKEVSDE